MLGIAPFQFRNKLDTAARPMFWPSINPVEDSSFAWPGYSNIEETDFVTRRHDPTFFRGKFRNRPRTAGHAERAPAQLRKAVLVSPSGDHLRLSARYHVHNALECLYEDACPIFSFFGVVKYEKQIIAVISDLSESSGGEIKNSCTFW